MSFQVENQISIKSNKKQYIFNLLIKNVINTEEIKRFLIGKTYKYFGKILFKSMDIYGINEWQNMFVASKIRLKKETFRNYWFLNLSVKSWKE